MYWLVAYFATFEVLVTTMHISTKLASGLSIAAIPHHVPLQFVLLDCLSIGLLRIIATFDVLVISVSAQRVPTLGTAAVSQCV